MSPLREQVRREIFRLAMPAVMSSLLQRAVSIIDVFLVGGLGASAIAAVGVGQLLVFMSMTLMWGFSSGVTVVVAQLWGARRTQDASRIAFQSLLFSLVLSTVISVVGGLWGHHVAVFLGVEPTVMVLAQSYLRIIFIVFGFTALVNVLCNIYYAVGDTRTPFLSVLVVNILHVLIAYPLIYGYWGAPMLGVEGAAIAIGISEAAGAAIMAVVLYQRGLLHIGRFRLETLNRVIRIGLPVFCDRALQQAGQAIYLKMIIFYGTAAYAAHQVGLSIEAFSFMPGFGIAIAATTAVGQSLGANRRDRADLANWEANRIAVLLMAGMGIIFFFFPYLLLRLFTTDPEVIHLGTLFLKVAAVLQIPLAITMVLSGSLKGAGDTRYLLFTTIIGSWVIRVPLAYVFSRVLGLGLPFVWGVMVIDWLVRMSLLLYRYRSERWHRHIPYEKPEVVHGTLDRSA
jgi:putative MATE family efflux protein